MPTNNQRNILVTSALPYANGSIHLGHLVEYIQTDVWVKFQKMQGHVVTYCCADDAHGTPIMLRANAENISPQQLIDKIYKEHSEDFAKFDIDFDNFYSTHSPENKELSQSIYRKLRDNGYIFDKSVTQAYDSKKNMFLPDRFVKGNCPKCGVEDQYGDNCEACGSTYSPTDLINPVSTVSGTKPIQKSSKHYFFDLPQLETFLKLWLEETNIQPEIKNKMQEWFESGFSSWDISRDKPYWGFEIPDLPEGEEKCFYVWLDAPIGYMASFKNYCNSNKNKQNLVFDDYFSKDSKTELYHFIGKDIAYFHTLFWPATLEGAGYRKPTGVFCHGFLMVNGKKMSKSRGTFIKADTYSKHLNTDFLRYYFSSKLSSSVEDIDLNLEDFKQKTNSDLVGKLVNLASRNAGFITKKFEGKLSTNLDDKALFNHFSTVLNEEVALLFDNREFAQAIRKIMQLADKANEYIDAEKPWVLAKQEDQLNKLHDVSSMGINLFYQLIIALKPVIPSLYEQSAKFLNLNEVSWESIKNPLLGKKINKYQSLATRVDDQSIESMVEESKEKITMKTSSDQKIKSTKINKVEEASSSIEIGDFSKLDLRVAKVLKCEHVEGADKLLKFTLDVGELGQKQVFSGIKIHYPNFLELEGKNVTLVANLAPRKMRFGLSEGMILSSEGNDSLTLVFADTKASPGDKIK